MIRENKIFKYNWDYNSRGRFDGLTHVDKKYNHLNLFFFKTKTMMT